jgi:hypothetical protein
MWGHRIPKWSESKGYFPGGAPVAKTVLIVDDNEFLRQALCDLFQRQGDFEVCAGEERTDERQLKWLSSCFPI